MNKNLISVNSISTIVNYLCILLILYTPTKVAADTIEIDTVAPPLYARALLYKQIAILPFEIKSPEGSGTDKQSNNFSEFFTRRLEERLIKDVDAEKKQYYSLYERDKLMLILREQKLQHESLAFSKDLKQIVAVGKLASVKAIYFGSIIIQTEEVREVQGKNICNYVNYQVGVTIKAVSVEQAEVFYSRFLNYQEKLPDSSNNRNCSKSPDGSTSTLNFINNIFIKAVEDISEDLLPSAKKIQVTYKSTSTLVGIYQNYFTKGVQAMKSNVLDHACKYWASTYDTLAKANKKSDISLLFNLALCAELQMTLMKAKKLYQEAHDLAYSLGIQDTDLSQALTRIKSEISKYENNEELITQEAKIPLSSITPTAISLEIWRGYVGFGSIFFAGNQNQSYNKQYYQYHQNGELQSTANTNLTGKDKPYKFFLGGIGDYENISIGIELGIERSYEVFTYKKIQKTTDTFNAIVKKDASYFAILIGGYTEGYNSIFLSLGLYQQKNTDFIFTDQTFKSQFAGLVFLFPINSSGSSLFRLDYQVNFTDFRTNDAAGNIVYATRNYGIERSALYGSFHFMF